MIGFQEFSYTSEDGLALCGRLYGSLPATRLPLVCLPGLTRNARDFHGLASVLSNQADPRPLIAFDYRGRGRSEWSLNAATYSVPQEAKDVLAGLAHLGVGRAVFVGTSRGALIIQLLALMQPAAIAAAVLNDAGPRIEAEGLRAIRGYVGRSGPFADWADAAGHVRSILAATFPALSDAHFAGMSRAAYIETEDGIIAAHDPKLADQLALLDLDQPLPELWEAFAALKPVPVLVIRGEHSALLSKDTVLRMQSLHPDLHTVEVPGQGHAPLLETSDLPGHILALADRGECRPPN